MKTFKVTFVKMTGFQREPTEDVAFFPVQAETKIDAIMKAMEMWRTGNVTDDWSEIHVR